MTILLAVGVVLYLIMMSVLRRGLELAQRTDCLPDYEPSVSIIVAARNEEDCIAACIESLLRISYPREKLECIIVNDGSTDRTREIVERYSAECPSIRIVNALRGSENLLGKANALAQGIEASHGTVLMFTDADCVVRETWVKDTVKYFKGNVGIVGGFTLLTSGSIFEGMQALDWIFLFSISSAMAGLKLPLTVIGNNLSVLRLAYDEVGGFKAVPFSVTEDYALVQSIVTRTNYTVAFPIDRATVVQSKACGDLNQLFRQKQRWGVGGLDMILRGMIILSVGWIMRILLLLGLISVHNPVLLISIAAIFLIDIRFLFKPLRSVGVLSYLKYIFFFELYYMFYVPAIPFVALLSKQVVWKERKL